VKKQYFSENTYKTEVSNSGSGISSRFRRTRLYFIIRFVRIVFRSRRMALDGKYDWDQWTRSSNIIMHLIEKSGGIIDIKGFENIKNLKEPVVFVSNHMSTFETMVFPCLIAPFMDVTFVVKDSLVSFPLFGPIMRSRNPIVVSRGNSRDDLIVVLEKGSELLQTGTSIIIFPQSTRKPYFEISKFNSLAVKLAARNKAKVVPVAIKTDYWQNGKLISELGPFDQDNKEIFIEFGEPFEPSVSGKEIHRQVIEFITERLRLWGAKVID
jgi:1-acyl-sn-glycerol-3-phosphate acyltransferase